jgi:FADH2 O2-dependent halogenase
MVPALYDPYDVAILGSGLAGSILGAILARNGVRVLLIDVANHPRFAIGESTIPHFQVSLRILAQRYGVPEISTLADVRECTKRISNTFGVKQHFGFMVQRDGQEPDPAQTHLLATPRVLNRAAHLFRQDSDAYLFRAAARYGCDNRQGWRVLEIDIDSDGVTLLGANDEMYRARYLVDASGARSPLAGKFDLHERPCRFDHHSRSIFTHMIGVRPLDDVLRHARRDRPGMPWHSGTMHHIFERGWLWVIPFDNYRASGNPLCSVGLTLDERVYPRDEQLKPEQEFWEHVQRFPVLARQFAGARSVREWVSTSRLQYSSRQSVGYRWCLMSHATGFVDPLFSLGLSNTVEVINALAGRLLAALRDDDFSVDRFRFVEQLEQAVLDVNDDLVNCSFIAFSHPRLWDAVFRVWGLGATPAIMRLTHALLRATTTGDNRVLDGLESARHTGLWWPDHDGFARLFTLMVDLCKEYDTGEISGDQAADQLMAAIQRADFVPPMGWKDPSRRLIVPRSVDVARLLAWAAFGAPRDIRLFGRGIARAVFWSALRGRRVL